MANVMTPEFRVSFPNVFEPQAPQNGTGKPKYNLAMLFAADADLSQLKAAAKEAMKAKWGDETPRQFKHPFLKAEDFDYDGYEEGMTVIRASSTVKPGLVDIKVQPIIDQSEFYAGCYARATVNAFAWEARNDKGAVINRGVSFGLQNIQKIRDGEPFGAGRTKAEDDFAPVGGSAARPESTDDIFA